MKIISVILLATVLRVPCTLAEPLPPSEDNVIVSNDFRDSVFSTPPEVVEEELSDADREFLERECRIDSLVYGIEIQYERNENRAERCFEFGYSEKDTKLELAGYHMRLIRTLNKLKGLLEEHKRRPRVYAAVCSALDTDARYDIEQDYADLSLEQQDWHYWDARLRALGDELKSSKAFGIPVVEAPDEVVPCDDRVDGPTNSSSGLNRDHSEKIEASGPVDADTSADGVNVIPASAPEKTEPSNDKSLMKPLLAIFGIGGLLGWIVFRRK